MTSRKIEFIILNRKSHCTVSPMDIRYLSEGFFITSLISEMFMDETIHSRSCRVDYMLQTGIIYWIMANSWVFCSSWHGCKDIWRLSRASRHMEESGWWMENLLARRRRFSHFWFWAGLHGIRTTAPSSAELGPVRHMDPWRICPDDANVHA